MSKIAANYWFGFHVLFIFRQRWLTGRLTFLFSTKMGDKVLGHRWGFRRLLDKFWPHITYSVTQQLTNSRPIPGVKHLSVTLHYSYLEWPKYKTAKPLLICSSKVRWPSSVPDYPGQSRFLRTCPRIKLVLPGRPIVPFLTRYPGYVPICPSLQTYAYESVAKN